MSNHELGKIESHTSDDIHIEKSNQRLSVQELVIVLREFSKILALANATNPELSEAVRRLANMLSKYKNRPIDDVLDNLTIQKRRHPLSPVLKTSKTITYSEAKAFTLEHIERLIESGRLSKSDLITIAMGKFSMSKADLMKTKTTYVVEAIKTAITNLRTIEIIGKQAAGER